MHTKIAEPTEIDHENRSIRKSKSASNLSVMLLIKYSLKQND